MIYNRTQEDVEQAEQIFTTKVLKLMTLNDEEKQVLARGRVTKETLNRIESKQAEIAEILKKWHYLGDAITNKEWNTQVFFDEDLTRICENNKKLRNAFYIISQEMRNAVPMFHFEEFNIVEKILAELDLLISATRKSFKRSGTFAAEQATLPLKGVGN